MKEQDLETSVLIVGAGPAGLAASLALTRYGVPNVLIERHPGTAHTPRAHIVNQRTVEILRDLGMEDRFRAAATPNSMMRNNLWVTTLAGREIARTETWGTSAERAGEYAMASPCAMGNCPQTVLEPLLLTGAQDAGADVRFNHDFVSAVQDADCVRASVRDRVTGDLFQVRAEYLIGADGARSRVLGEAGLSIDGPDNLGHAMNLWFRADLTRYFAHRPGVLTWNVMPGPLPPLRLGTLICHKPFTEFVLVSLYDPEQLDLQSIDPAILHERINALVGEDVDAEILGVAGWQVKAQVASAYTRGRILCAGDAVHRHPPSNGLGLNMSIADAYNMAWKLALVLAGKAGPALLDTYSTERQPVGAAGVHRAIVSLEESFQFDAALGYAEGQSEAEGWAQLDMLDAAGPDGDARRAALRKALEVSHLQFNAHGIELGYVYESDAVVADGRDVPPPARDPVLFYEPTTRPGARVPHARVELDRQPMSTLDLVPELGFALLTGPGGEPWAAAADAAATRFGLPIIVHSIGGPDSRVADCYGEWAQRREVESSGCVLVRPDRHVGWRASRCTPDAVAQLDSAIARILAVAEREAAATKSIAPNQYQVGEPSMTGPIVERNVNRYEMRIDGELAGFTEFADRERQRIFFHTEIGQAHQGQGLSSVLIGHALTDTRDAGLRVVPVCPAVAAYVKKHGEFADIVDPVTPAIGSWLQTVMP